ncbi:non-specific serine/threonine protein kinase [Trifolium repens]|nr:non-specific serine/threonine protein kinase [Trifolium repens]
MYLGLKPLPPSVGSYKRLSISSSMKFTCLSKDLSALMAFSPIPTSLEALSFEERNNNEKRQKIENLLEAKSLIFAEPWYKTVNNLHLWNASLIDVILISSPMGIMGLPFLTRRKGFSAKIYVTEASARLGQLMMENLVSMHVEFKQFYGPEESNFPPWLRQEELEILPSVLKEILLGKDGVELGGWMPLYSAADVKDCILKINTVNYAQEVCYNGTLVIKAFSSGIEIGSCNWILNGPKGDIAYLSSSYFFSAHAMTFDYRSLKGTSSLVYSDLSSLSDAQDIDDGDNNSDPTSDTLFPPSFQDLDESSLNSNENLKEKEKLVYLLEEMTTLLEASAMEVPIYIISSVAEELLALLNIIPEWLCKQRQERLFDGEPLFAYVKLLKEKKIHVVPDIYSPQLLKNWQEPCIVFCPHWSLRIGPAVHLLRRWCGDSKSLLIFEDIVNLKLALLPFEPVAMNLLQCLFSSGIGLQKVQPLLKTLQPKTVLFPEDLRLKTSFSCEKSFSVLYYTEAETLKVSSQKDSSDLKIAADLASQFYWKTFKKEGINVTRLKGNLLMENGRHHLDNNKKTSKSTSSLVRCGLADYNKLLPALSEMGINASMELVKEDVESQNVCVVHTEEPYKALIEIGNTSTVIKTADANVASIHYKAIDKILDGV